MLVISSYYKQFKAFRKSEVRFYSRILSNSIIYIHYIIALGTNPSASPCICNLFLNFVFHPFKFIMSDILQNKAATFLSLGCKLNFVENSSVCDLLEQHGVHRAQAGEPADICIINTCTVTETANHKSRQAIHKVIRDNPDALVVVMGCYAQTNAQTLAEIDGVDLVVGMEQKGNVVKLIEEKLEHRLPEESHKTYNTDRKDITSFVPSCSHGTRTRYFLKIQDGCDYFCTYCAIPLARGRSRNGSIASLVSQAEQVARQGGKEIVITGVNIGDFGKSTGEKFYDLIKALDQIEGIRRYRISSIEPNLLTREIIDFCARSRSFMPHFHIPLQSGSNEILKLMHRRYDTAMFADKIRYIRETIPDAFIGVDIIVGTRGETAALWEESYAFAQDLDISQFHVFSYSERPGTAALRIPHTVSEQEKHQRSQCLLKLSEKKRKAFYKRYIGTERLVLTEHSHEQAQGFTDNYIKVEIPELNDNPDIRDNQLVKVRLKQFNLNQDALVGEVIRQT